VTRDRHTRDRHTDDAPTPGQLGLPEHSALTMEGRVERAGMVGSRLANARRGDVRPLRRSPWAFGLWLILALLVAVVAVAVITSLT
jgi:hypothetical protein